MSPDPIDRRAFLGLGGAAFFCTLVGREIRLDKGEVSVEGLAQKVPVPPRVLATQEDPAGNPIGLDLSAVTANGPVREYWIAAEERRWNIIPTHFDQVYEKKIKGKSTFPAYVYRPYSANFEKPLAPGSIPGPLIEAEVGETVIVHFRNKLPVPATIHPHGIYYSEEMDGAYKGKWTPPGGFVQKNRTFTYIWEAKEGTEGTWLYHDHGPMDMLTVFKGLHGPLVVRKPGEVKADREFFLAFDTLEPGTTGLNQIFYGINGKAYPGNTPTLEAKVGERVAFHIYGVDNYFHTFHLHGHRWTEPDGRIVDNKSFGPADSFRIEFTEDNPGRWYYHCHVFIHLDDGMAGWYLVS